MTRARQLLKPLDDLAYLIECAALDHRGELKYELGRLCDQIRTGADGYGDQVVQDALEELDSSLEAFRGGEKPRGTSGLVRVSRSWWEAARPGPASD